MKYSLDVPFEVTKVIAYCYMNQPVGEQVYKESLATIAKYPQYFPWEHLYKSIPKEVHAAYDLEAHGPRKSAEEILAEFRQDIPTGGGLMEYINSQPKYEYKHDPNFDIGKALKEIIEAEHKNRMDEIAEESRLKKIWNKHYRKYKLTYPTTSHFL